MRLLLVVFGLLALIGLLVGDGNADVAAIAIVFVATGAFPRS